MISVLWQTVEASASTLYQKYLEDVNVSLEERSTEETDVVLPLERVSKRFLLILRS